MHCGAVFRGRAHALNCNREQGVEAIDLNTFAVRVNYLSSAVLRNQEIQLLKERHADKVRSITVELASAYFIAKQKLVAIRSLIQTIPLRYLN